MKYFQGTRVASGIQLPEFLCTLVSTLLKGYEVGAEVVITVATREEHVRRERAITDLCDAIDAGDHGGIIRAREEIDR